ncbi:hypothetical protein ACFCQI_14185 [Rhodanobacter sp. FW102-FHT14D06]|uniref:Uncharacterized protein n=2 Tax=unclassified Rhodanobacter TaxID=2621553 RepID=A0AB74V0F8_9GAMM
MIVYHYTIRDCATAIINSGSILPATAGVPVGEKPVVWFSSNKTWEPTANKMILHPSGLLRSLTFPEMVKLVLVRFAMPSDTLLTWPQIIEATGVSDDMVTGLKRAARKQGAKPSEWFGSLSPVPVEGLVMDMYQGGAWQQVGQLQEAA